MLWNDEATQRDFPHFYERSGFPRKVEEPGEHNSMLASVLENDQSHPRRTRGTTERRRVGVLLLMVSGLPAKPSVEVDMQVVSVILEDVDEGEGDIDMSDPLSETGVSGTVERTGSMGPSGAERRYELRGVP